MFDLNGVQAPKLRVKAAKVDAAALFPFAPAAGAALGLAARPEGSSGPAPVMEHTIVRGTRPRRVPAGSMSTWNAF